MTRDAVLKYKFTFFKIAINKGRRELARHSMLQSLIGKEEEHLSPADAVREVCRDLKFITGQWLRPISISHIDSIQVNCSRTLIGRRIQQKCGRIQSTREQDLSAKGQ
jgi:hypothetical protein